MPNWKQPLQRIAATIKHVFPDEKQLLAFVRNGSSTRMLRPLGVRLLKGTRNNSSGCLLSERTSHLLLLAGMDNATLPKGLAARLDSIAAQLCGSFTGKQGKKMPRQSSWPRRLA